MKKNRRNLSTLAILFTIATGAIHFINKSIIASASNKNLVKSSINHHFYQWRFGRIYYTKQGSGKPLLLIHDLQAGASCHEWNKIESALAENHEVYTIDLLGCGQSEKPQITYTNFFYVQLLCDFVKQVIGKKADIVASGYSGSFTVMSCLNDADLFDKVLLINPPDLNLLNQVPRKNSRLQKLILETPVFGTMIYNILMSRQNIEHIFCEKLFYNPFRINPVFLDTFYESAHSDGCKGKYMYASQIANYTNINIQNGLAKVNHSIYIIEGANETSGRKIPDAYVDINPAIEVSYVDHSKHFPHLENPEEFLEQAEIYLYSRAYVFAK